MSDTLCISPLLEVGPRFSVKTHNRLRIKPRYSGLYPFGRIDHRNITAKMGDRHQCQRLLGYSYIKLIVHHIEGMSMTGTPGQCVAA